MGYADGRVRKPRTIVKVHHRRRHSTELEATEGVVDCACVPDTQLGVKIQGGEGLVGGQGESPDCVVERGSPLGRRQFLVGSIALVVQLLLVDTQLLLVLGPVLLVGVARDCSGRGRLKLQCLEVKGDKDGVSNSRDDVVIATTVSLLVVGENEAVGPVNTPTKRVLNVAVGEDELVGGERHPQVERPAHEHADGVST